MIVIYGRDNCSWCTKAKNLAEQYRLKYEYKNTNDSDTLNELKAAFPAVKTVPQIWWDNRHLGGYDSFASEIENTLGNFGQQDF